MFSIQLFTPSDVKDQRKKSHSRSLTLGVNELDGGLSNFHLWLLQRFIIVNLCFIALWATRQTEDTEKDRELHVKTTLRELVVYIVFLVILCVGEYPAGLFKPIKSK